MSQRLRVPPALAATLVLAFVGIGAVGCAKKLTAIDPSLAPPSFPEGVRDSLSNSPSDLVVWPDLPHFVQLDWADTTRADLVFTRFHAGDGASVGTILDYVGASGYQMFRRENGGGFRRFFDFTLAASRRWADRSYFGTSAGSVALPPAQLFVFTDPAPPAAAIPGYMGRSVVSGISGARSPLTNLGEVTGGIGPIGGTLDVRDSLVDVRWDPVAGAKGFWLHIYQPRNDIRTSGEAIATGFVAPVAIGKVRDLFIGYFPATLPGYKLGNPVPPGARVLLYRVIPGLTTVRIRVSAVDSAGQLIATTGRDLSDGDFSQEATDVGEYFEEDRDNGNRTIRFPLRAVEVQILRPGTGEDEPSPARPAHLGRPATESGVPGVVYFRPAQVGRVRAFP